jgi:dTDP-4-amino-4,6-dideoxygalactose transaminase
VNRVPFLDLAADWSCVADDATGRVNSVLASQGYVLGAQTRELESSASALLDGAHALAVSSGSDALYLAMLALGIGPGDAVLLPSFTFFATAGAVVRAGAQPIFVDLDPVTFNSETAQFEAALLRECDEDGAVGAVHRETGARVRAVVVVHLYGRAVAMQSLVDWAASRGLAVVEDAAQAVGARCDSRALGTWGDVGCFSFYPTKNLGGPGDGGLVSCRDPELAARLARLRVHGAGGHVYEHLEVGINARMSELVAAVLNAKMVHLQAWNTRRREIAARYRKCLASVPGLVLPAPAAEEDEHVWHQYVVRIATGREAVIARMDAAGIDTRVFYPLPLHRQECFKEAGVRAGELVESDGAAGSVLCLPIYASLADEAVERVASSLAAALAG